MTQNSCHRFLEAGSESARTGNHPPFLAKETLMTQDISKIISKAQAENFQPSSAHYSKTPNESGSSMTRSETLKHRSAMMRLWALLTAELGSAFRNQYGPSEGETFNYWVHELKDFTEEQLVNGFNKFKESGSTYMSLNIFRNHCRVTHSDLGLPSFEEAYHAVIFSSWTKMPAAFRVLFADHAFNLRKLSASDSRKSFKPLYDDAVARVARGEKFTLPNNLHIAPQPSSNPSGVVHAKRRGNLKEVGNQAMANLLKGLGGKKLA